MVLSNFVVNTWNVLSIFFPSETSLRSALCTAGRSLDWNFLSRNVTSTDLVSSYMLKIKWNIMEEIEHSDAFLTFDIIVNSHP